jgi:hypothetical protein
VFAEPVLLPATRIWFVRGHDLQHGPHFIAAVNMQDSTAGRASEHEATGPVFVIRIALDDFASEEALAEIGGANHPTQALVEGVPGKLPFPSEDFGTDCGDVGHQNGPVE